MKTTLRTDFTARESSAYNGCFQNESFEHQNDIVLQSLPGKSTKDIVFAKDAQAVAYIVEAVVKTRRGELYLDKYRGIPYFESMLGVKGDTAEWEGWVRDYISKCNGVQRLNEFSTTRTRGTRRQVLDYQASIQTEWGDTEIDSAAIRKLYSSSVQLFYRPSAAGKFSRLIVKVPTDSPTNINIRIRVSESVQSGTIYFGDGERLQIARSDYAEQVGKVGDGKVYAAKTYNAAGQYEVALDDGIEWFKIGRDDDDSGSRNLVIGVSEWSDGVVSAFETFKGCTNIVGQIPSWGQAITNAHGTYSGCIGITDATLPEWNDEMTDIGECYDGCVNIGLDFRLNYTDTIVNFLQGVNLLKGSLNVPDSVVKTISVAEATLRDGASAFNAIYEYEQSIYGTASLPDSGKIAYNEKGFDIVDKFNTLYTTLLH